MSPLFWDIKYNIVVYPAIILELGGDVVGSLLRILTKTLMFNI